MVLDKATFADGWLRLTSSQSAFVTPEQAEVAWQVLKQLNPAQWSHAVRMALEDSKAPEPGKMWPTGTLLGWGRSYLDPNVLRLPEPKGATEDSEFPRKPGEGALAYIQRYARHLGGMEVKSMPKPRLPYRDDLEIDRGEDADSY